MDEAAPPFGNEDSVLIDVAPFREDEDSKLPDVASKLGNVDSKSDDVDPNLNDEASRFSDVDSIRFNVAPKFDDVDSISNDEASNNCFKDSNSGVKTQTQPQAIGPAIVGAGFWPRKNPVSVENPALRLCYYRFAWSQPPGRQNLAPRLHLPHMADKLLIVILTFFEVKELPDYPGKEAGAGRSIFVRCVSSHW